MNLQYADTGPSFDQLAVDTHFSTVEDLWRDYSYQRSELDASQHLVILSKNKDYYSSLPLGVLWYDAMQQADNQLQASGSGIEYFDIHVLLHGIGSDNSGLPGGKTAMSGLFQEAFTIQELVHGFNVQHSNGWDTPSNPYDIPSGVVIPRGNQFCAMAKAGGNFGNDTNLNVRLKHRMGWMGPSLQSVTEETLTYVLHPSDQSSDPSLLNDELRGIRIRGDDNFNYWLELRQDPDILALPAAPNLDGLIVLWGFNDWQYLDLGSSMSITNQQSLQLDMTPGSAGPEPQDDFEDGLLLTPNGSTVTPEGIEIRALSMDTSFTPAAINVEITLPVGHTTQFDQPAEVNIASPINGVSTIDGSLPFQFHVKAHDLDAGSGSVDGEGISQVVFKFFTIDGVSRAPFYTHVDTSPPFTYYVENFTDPLGPWARHSGSDQGFILVARVQSDAASPSTTQYWNEAGTFFMVDFP